MSLTTEKHYKIWDDTNGCRLEVGPDRDGLDLIELRSITSDGKEEASFTLTPEQALELVSVLTDVTRTKN